MQSSVKLKVSSGLAILSDLSISLNLKDKTIKEQLTHIIAKDADQIAYMLQAYHPREKVSRAEVVPDSIDLSNPEIIRLKIQYVLEEFSACSAIDTLNKERMTLTIFIDQLTGELELKGEYWPERDADSL
ncbi:hypothetical protein TH53_25105 [Pedobacter lusitanus]|uniref:Contig148, whole genome shotgun sequence n=1 Tax=Pedobacter lusitanus TaxID=1503925 RepID=A0A0D0EZ51_9SPHI|nr:hypothetical protein [Pedobacter lusitanus]KIO74663.1 hypothetical protein TH53_25105 [Pedobacter lusitanus]